jgi:hypothetical protein
MNNALQDAIIAHPQAEEIKAFWARNLAQFHHPDSPQDILHMILKSVRSMSSKKGFDFLEEQLGRSDKINQLKLQSVLKNPQLLFIFSDLMTLPMFEQVKLLTFHKLEKWRYIVPCWLGTFLLFARDSYRYITFPAKKKISSILEVKDQETSTTEYTFDFLDNSFHNIIDEAYRDHLATSFLAFGVHDRAVDLNGEAKKNWSTSFMAYREQVLEKLNEWSKDKKRPKNCREHLSVLIQRVTYILDNAYEEYPFISKLNAPLPLACNTFIQDLAQDLYGHQESMFEVCLVNLSNF